MKNPNEINEKCEECGHPLTMGWTGDIYCYECDSAEADRRNP